MDEITITDTSGNSIVCARDRIRVFIDHIGYGVRVLYGGCHKITLEEFLRVAKWLGVSLVRV